MKFKIIKFLVDIALYFLRKQSVFRFVKYFKFTSWLYHKLGFFDDSHPYFAEKTKLVQNEDPSYLQNVKMVEHKSGKYYAYFLGQYKGRVPSKIKKHKIKK